MSRAFIKESDDTLDVVPERLVSGAPNLVTPEGLAAIKAEIQRLTRALSAAQVDASARARLARDLRYWSARRSSAQMAPPPADTLKVHFGSTVVIDRDDVEHTYRIVGEDEADPQRGTIAHSSPMARALLGNGVGDVVKVARGDIEIVAIR